LLSIVVMCGLSTDFSQLISRIGIVGDQLQLPFKFLCCLRNVVRGMGIVRPCQQGSAEAVVNAPTVGSIAKTR
jgi:hypothetical protein